MREITLFYLLYAFASHGTMSPLTGIFKMFFDVFHVVYTFVTFIKFFFLQRFTSVLRTSVHSESSSYNNTTINLAEWLQETSK